MRATLTACISGLSLALTACGTSGVTLTDLAKAYNELPDDGCEHDLDVFISVGGLAPTPVGSFKASRHCDAKPIVPISQFGLPIPDE